MRTKILIFALLTSIVSARSNEPFKYVDSSNPAAAFTLMVRTPGKYCTGTLIAPDIALTAAHCLAPKDLEADQVRISFSAAASRKSNATVPPACHGRGLAVNPLWGDLQFIGTQPAFDLGLVYFSCQLPSNAQPITIDYAQMTSLTSLHGRSGMVTEDFPLSVVGYGNLSIDNPDPHKSIAIETPDPRLKLRQIELRVPRSEAAPTIVTLQGTRGFICHGDTGGAIFSPGSATEPSYLFGINSKTGFGQGCTTTSFAARVDTNYDWLRDAMIALGSHAPIRKRSSSASACAKIKAVAQADASPPFREIVLSNACSEDINCSFLGWSALSSGQMNPFGEKLRLGANEQHTIKIYTHKPEQGYATAICDRT